MNIRHPLCQALASVLAGLLFLNPIVATAAQLAVDAAAGGNASLGAAGNGVPIVNIATPNGAGLSHNKFSDYSVGQQGLILNNATGKTASTQLGGIVLGNPNLKGQAAQKILNEVTGGNPSRLQGYTEVAGQGAHVIVANPHGVTCNGCGFINTPRITLTTGKPILAGERLQGYDVDGGAISIEGAGLNAGNVDQFELITRSAKLNADLYAKQLSVVAGRNQVDAETLAASTKPDDGSAKPQLAIDSSALGGMYANSIRLVGTEAGIGVKLAGNMAASAGDIRIDANGKLELAQASASADLALKGQDIALSGPAYAGGSASVQATGTLSNAQSLAAGSRVQLSAVRLSNSGVIEAGVSPEGKGDLSITAQTLRNAGSLIASRDLNASAATLDNRNGRIGGQLIRLSGGSLDNRQGLFAAGQSLSLDLDHLDNREQGLLSSQGRIDGRVGSLDNQQGGITAQAIDLRSDTLNNHGGSLFANDRLAIGGGDFLNSGGQVSALSIDFSLRGTLDNTLGLFEASNQLTLAAASLNNNQGRLRALGEQGTTRITTSGLLDNRNGSLESAAQNLLIGSGSLLNDNGSVRHLGSGEFGLDLAQAGLAGGSFISNGSLSYQAASWTNASLIQARELNLDIGQLTQLASGQLLASGTFNGRGGDWSNAGNIAGGALTHIDLGGQLDNSGRLTSDGDLRVHAASLNNHGTLGSGANLRLETPSLLNENGLIFSGADMTLRVGSFTNRFADVFSLGALDLAADDAGSRAARLDNLSATLESQGDMRLNVSALNNARAVLVVNDAGKYTAQIVEVNCYKYLNDSIADCSGKRNGVWEITERDKLEVLQASAASSISAGGDLRIDADQLNNASSQIAAGGNLYATVNRLTNQGVVTGEIETFRVFVSQRTEHMGSWRDEADAFSDQFWYESPNYRDDPAGLAAGLSHFLART
ncbi:filamentous hemagglutinin N-terminal domain-containing protein, partial [Pseudomonas citronellolis]|uniref:filamentous hemagglutinin N-terminal domain-containing protein n=1 Tax=Pseudomonas citronellolis TaxID=53408 RepID=UPI0023E3C072